LGMCKNFQNWSSHARQTAKPPAITPLDKTGLILQN